MPDEEISEPSGHVVKLVKTPKKLLRDQHSIAELVEQVAQDILNAGKNWTEAKPGIKVTWLKVARKHLDRLIAMAEMEEEVGEVG
jgi:hypothetical protein